MRERIYIDKGGKSHCCRPRSGWDRGERVGDNVVAVTGEVKFCAVEAFRIEPELTVDGGLLQGLVQYH